MSAGIGGWDTVRGGGTVGRRCSVGSTEDVSRVEGRLPLVSYCRTRLGNFVWGNRESRKGLWAACLIFWQVWPVIEQGVPAS